MSRDQLTNIENSSTFGNYLLHGIDEIILPDNISWWPTAPGWKVLGAIILIWLTIRLVRWLKYRWRNRYRREALRQLDQIQSRAGTNFQEVVAVLPYYLKVAALQAYPRQVVAGLSGKKWLLFLDAHYAGPSFSGAIGSKLLSVAYLPNEHWQLEDHESIQLIKMVRLWIAKHV